MPNKGKTGRSGSIETYREMIEVMDEGVGRILQAVNDANLSSNTFIIFLSDNGPSGFGSAGQLRGKKGQIREGGHRVPAIACCPGRIKAGSVSHETAMGADLLPTITEMIGASQPKDVRWDSISLLVPWDGGYVKLFKKKMGEVVSAEKTIQFWVKHNKCSPTAKTVTLPDKNKNDHSTVRMTSYKNKDTNVKVIHYTIDGGGHSLPGSRSPDLPRIVGRKNRDINAVKIILDFFSNSTKSK